jgi:hypothetical protein
MDAEPATRRALDVVTKASTIVWSAAQTTKDPKGAIEDALGFATDLIARLMLRAGPGKHLVTCVTKRSDGSIGLHVSMPISGTAQTAVIPNAATEQAFGALLMLGFLTGEPVGMLMRSCSDDRHYAPRHTSVVRGWMVLDSYALPMKDSAICAIFTGGPGSAPPPHPEKGVRYETAFSLYGGESDADGDQ